MREISAETITNSVARLFIEANTCIGDDMVSIFNSCLKSETSHVCCDVVSQLIINAELARETGIPLCQDTGLAVVFLAVGQDLHITGGNILDAVNEGIRQGCRDGYLRPSVVSPPIGARVNTGDNTPAIIHISIIPGDRLIISISPKGGGSENVSALRMLRPTDGMEGIKRFVLDTVAKAGSNPCPPLVIGVGIGGSFELCALLAKRALLRRIGDAHPDLEISTIENELLESVNRLGIGPAGLGGNITALAVHIETHPCHLTSLPVAVNINCHSYRHSEAEL